jgi:hypothetical protein
MISELRYDDLEIQDGNKGMVESEGNDRQRENCKNQWEPSEVLLARYIWIGPDPRKVEGNRRALTDMMSSAGYAIQKEGLNMAKFLDSQIIQGSRDLLDAWDREVDVRVSNSEDILVHFESEGIRQIVRKRRTRIVKQVETLFSRFVDHGIDKLIGTINPLDILLKYYSPNEDDHSNLMAVLLDPKARHGLGWLGLHALIDIVTRREKRKAEVCQAIRDETMSPLGKDIILKVRKRSQLSVPDIEVYGHNFFINIENKRSFGQEHETAYGWQTENQYSDGIQRKQENSLFIYIHPDTRLPRSREFVGLDKHDVLQWYLILADSAQNKDLGAFLKFYSNYYFKTI